MRNFSAVSTKATNIRSAGQRSLDSASRKGPLLTVAIPTFNRSQSVSRVVHKFLECRSTRDVEVLVVDDGSSDGTAEILHAIAADHANVKVKALDQNTGYANALATAIRESSGEWVLVNSDDDEMIASEVDILKRALPKLKVDFLSTQWLLASGEVYRGRPTSRPIGPSDLRSSANHAPALLYRRSAALPVLDYLLDLLDSEDEAARLYPQVFLAAHSIAGGKGLWWPRPLGREGESLPSGLRSIGGKSYTDPESRLAQAIALRRSLRLMTQMREQSFRYRSRSFRMMLANEGAVIWALNLLCSAQDPLHDSVYRTVLRSLVRKFDR